MPSNQHNHRQKKILFLFHSIFSLYVSLYFLYLLLLSTFSHYFLSLFFLSLLFHTSSFYCLINFLCPLSPLFSLNTHDTFSLHFLLPISLYIFIYFLRHLFFHILSFSLNFESDSRLRKGRGSIVGSGERK